MHTFLGMLADPDFLRKKLQQHALRTLARREHSRHELQQKLAFFAQCLLAKTPLPAQRLRPLASLAPREPDEPHEPSDLSALIAQVLQSLTQQGLCSDERYAQSVVRSQSARMGRMRLQQTLQRKGIDGDTASTAIAAIEQDDEERAWQLWHKRYGASLPALLAGDTLLRQKAQAKQMRFLQGRGFDSAVIRSVLRRAYGKF